MSCFREFSTGNGTRKDDSRIPFAFREENGSGIAQNLISFAFSILNACEMLFLAILAHFC